MARIEPNLKQRRGARVAHRLTTAGQLADRLSSALPSWVLLSALTLAQPFAADASVSRGTSAQGAKQSASVNVSHAMKASSVPGQKPARVEATALKAAAATRDISPTQYETWNDLNGDATYDPAAETYNDFGVDHLADVNEPGAFGADGKPGRANVDDNQDGVVDNSAEYLTAGTDDVADPAHDNYNATSNPTGTEKNGIFESIALAGYQGFMGEDIRPMNGVHDPLSVRALVLTNGDTTSVLVVADLLGVLFNDLNPVKRRIESELKIPFDNIIISSTHTHAGPDTVGIWAGQTYPSYMDYMRTQMFAAVSEAVSKLQTVQVRSATASPSGCYERDTLIQRPEAECYLGDYESANLEQGASYDQFMLQVDLRDPWVRRMEIPVLQLINAQGATVATLLNFDDHPEVMLDENPYASSDFPHYVRQALEDALGGVAIYISGTVGCQMGALRGTPIPLYDELGHAVYQTGIYDANGNPVPAWASGPENRTRSLGYTLANFALRAIQSATYVTDPPLAINRSWIDVSIENPVYRILVNKIKKTLEPADKAYLIRAPWCSSTGCIRTALHSMRLGNATFLTAPGEFPPEYVVGRAASVTPYSQTDPGYEDYAFPAMPGLEDAVKTPEFFFVGMANSYYGYAIPKSDTLPLSESDHPNFYEEEYDANLCFGDAVGNRLMQMLSSSATFSDCVPKP